MEEFIKETGRMEKYMVLESIRGQMENSIMVSTIRIKSKGLAFIDGLMESSTRVDGIWASSMVRVR